MSKENWKEDFLNKITKRYGYDKIILKEYPQYRLIGLPFYNKEYETEFKQEYKKLYENKTVGKMYE